MLAAKRVPESGRWKELLTTLINHFGTPILELMGMECPRPSIDLPKYD